MLSAESIEGLRTKKNGSEKDDFAEQRRVFSDMLLLKNSLINFIGKGLIFLLTAE